MRRHRGSRHASSLRRTVATVLAALLSAVAYSAPAAWNPYTALRPRHLLALYPLLNDFQDYAPSGSSAAGYGQHGAGRVVESTSSNPNALEGTRLDRMSGIDLPLCIHPAVFPRLTMGAWVYTESIATQPACALSEDGSSVGRSICVQGGKWRVSGQREPRMSVTMGAWTFVAAVYDNAARSVSLFVDGALLPLDSNVAYGGGGSRISNASAVIGSGVNATNGFAGFVKSVFFYGEALNDHELRYLMTSKPLPLADGLARFDAGNEYEALFVGFLDAGVSDTVEAFSNEAKLIQLEVRRFESCEALTFTIHNVPDYGPLYKPDQILPTEPGDLIRPDDSLSSGSIYFGVPDHLNQDKTTSFSYSVNCDGTESLERVKIAVHIHSVQEIPHYTLASRVQYILSMANIYDPDEIEHNSAPSFALEVEGGYAPVVQLPGSSSASISQGDASSVSTIVHGSGTTSEINYLASSMKTEASQENPLSARFRLSIDSSDLPSDSKLASLYSFDHSIGSRSVIFEVSPQDIPVEGSTVELYGKNFAESFICVVGGSTSLQAVYVSPTHLRCVIPKQESFGLVTLSVHPSGMSKDKSNSVSVTVTPSIQISSVEPPNRIVHCGSEVIVQLFSTLVSHSSCRCQVSKSLVVIPHRVASNSVACRIPFINIEDESSTINFSIAQNMVNVVSAGDFQLVKRPQIHRLYPPSSCFSVKLQQIDLFGSNFLNRSELLCSIGGRRIPGKFVTAAHVRCLLPAPENSSDPTLPVEVSVNGVDFSKSGIAYSCIVMSSVKSVLPANGTIAGGTNIQISGENFSKDVFYSCQFGTFAREPADFVNQPTLHCKMAQMNIAGQVDLTVLANEVVLPAMSLSFMFTAVPTIERIFSQLGEVGRETQVMILGNGFEDVESLCCVFENGDEQRKSVAERVDSTLILCRTLVQIQTGTYDVRVSLNHQDFSPRSGQAKFVAYDQLIFFNASIAPGPSTGGSEVTITGKQFIASEHLTCKFGDQTCRAKFLSNTTIRCISPARNKQSIGRTVAIRIAPNGVQFSMQSIDFTYYVPPVITKVVPSTAPANASTSLVVIGSYFSRQHDLFCRIGSSVVKADLVDSERIKCGSIRTPMHAGTLDLSVSLNSQDYTYSAHTVSIHKAINLTRVEPPYVARGSNAVVKVSGTGFLATESATCWFGASEVNAFVASAELVLCPLPQSLSQGKFEIAISLNGVHVSRLSGLFVFVYEIPTFSAVLPKSGVSYGGELVTIIGAGYEGLGSEIPIFCIFGDMNPVPAKILNAPCFECSAPDAGSSFGEKNVPLSFQVGENVVRSSLIFTFFTPPVLTRVLPDTVVLGRSNTAIIDGYRFSRTRSYQVTLGNSSLIWNAMMLPNRSVIAFEFDGDGEDFTEDDRQSIRVSQNGAHFVDTGLQLTVVSPSKPLDVVYPESIPVAGSSIAVVAVCSQSLDPRSSYLCTFAGDTNKATWFSSTCLQCTAQSIAKLGKGQIDIIDEATRRPVRSVPIELYEAPEVVAIAPDSVEIEKEGEIFVFGKGFRQDLNFSCQFSSEISASAVVHNSTCASC